MKIRGEFAGNAFYSRSSSHCFCSCSSLRPYAQKLDRSKPAAHYHIRTPIQKVYQNRCQIQCQKECQSIIFQKRKISRSYVRSYIRIMHQGWGSLEESNFIFPSSTGWVLATVYILLGCVKAIVNLGTGGSIPNQMIAGPGFPRSSQALRSRACRWGWS